MKCKNCCIWSEKNWDICECPYYARFYKSFKDEEELGGTADGCCLTKNEIKKLDKLTREVKNHQYDHYQFIAKDGSPIPFLDLSKDQQEKWVEIQKVLTKTSVALLKYKIVLCERHPKEDE